MNMNGNGLLRVIDMLGLTVTGLEAEVAARDERIAELEAAQAERSEERSA